MTSSPGQPDDTLTPLFARRSLAGVPQRTFPATESAPDAVYEVIHDDLLLDGSSRLNLATFVTTWMEPQADRLMAETFDKNMIDRDEYPQTARIEHRCLAMLADLWHAPDTEKPVGTSTIGSSEAAMLGGLALKHRWRKRRGVSAETGEKPNLVLGINAQVCWEKFCRYWDVEPRFVPMSGDRLHLGVAEAIELCDENTIGVVGILGSTYDGSYEPIAELCAALDDYAATSGHDIPVHVDAASGGFVAPFLQPDLEWDFRLARVASVNASGHKFGLVYPGVGWVLWRDQDALPEELVFYTNYLGGPEPTMAINFSRPGSQVVAQYYNFVRLGRDGYTRIHQASHNVAQHVASELEKTGAFTMLTRGDDLPVLAFTVNESVGLDAFALSDRLRRWGWQVPAYQFPAGREDITALRIVCREGFGMELAEQLLANIRTVLAEVSTNTPACTEAFHH